MNLVSIKEVRESLGFEDMSDINQAISSVLPAVTSSMEVTLDTRFNLSTTEDVFFVPPYKGPDNGHVETKLRLSNGFIIPQTVIVTSGNTPQELDESPIPISTMKVRSYEDVAKGVLLDYKTVYTGGTRRLVSFEYMGGPYIRVAYTHGFDQDATDSKAYDQTAVPDWLKEAAILKAKIFLSSHPVVKNAEASSDPMYLENALRAMLLSHMRFVPGSLVPM